MSKSIYAKILERYGFNSQEELQTLIKKLLKKRSMRTLTKWRKEDGTKKGLLELLK